jgi:hypothetical protein
LRQAHARLEQYEDDLTDSSATYPPLRAVSGLDERPWRLRPGVDPGDDGAGRRPLIDLDDDLLDVRSTGRGAPRRPTGAAASYASAAAGSAPRRTVRIGGHGAQTALRPTPSELRGPRPDRIAAWAVGFAILLALMAVLVGG